MTASASSIEALQERLEQLELRLDRAESVQAIQELKARYGEVTDRRYTGEGFAAPAELEAIATHVSEMFTEDGVWDGGERLGRCVGREEIRQRFLEPTLHFAWHFFVKPRIRVDGDEAEGTWDIFAPCTGTDGRPWWMTGVEQDRYRRVDGIWLHSYMRLDMVFMAPYDRSWSRRWQPRRDP